MFSRSGKTTEVPIARAGACETALCGDHVRLATPSTTTGAKGSSGRFWLDQNTTPVAAGTVPVGKVASWDVDPLTPLAVSSPKAGVNALTGWLLQLDGDNQRNAFLNAPWAKAVMPIRPGKERQALNWLKQVEGMDTLTEDDLYAGPEPELQGKTLFEVLGILADKVAAKHEASTGVQEHKDPDQPLDDESTVHATPVDRVYEHGFYPLQGGFKATDQPNRESRLVEQGRGAGRVRGHIRAGQQGLVVAVSDTTCCPVVAQS